MGRLSTKKRLAMIAAGCPTWERICPNPTNNVRCLGKIVYTTRSGWEFCAANGLEYVCLSNKGMPKKEVFVLRLAGKVELDPRWEEKYQEWSKIYA